MRKFTLFFVFMITAAVVFAQKPVVTPVWEHSVNSTADWSTGFPVGGTAPAWMGSMTERGMAFYDGKLYIMSRKVTPPVIQVLDAETGNALTTIPIDTSIVKGGTFAVNDIAITPSGKIVFANLTTNSHTSAFKAYMMKEKTGGGYDVTNLFSWMSEDTINGEVQPFRRLGDGFAIYGDVSEEGDGYMMAADANAAAPEPLVYRWDIKAGVVTGEPVVIKLKGVYPAAVGTAVPKLGTTPRIWPLNNDMFWADGLAVYPTLYDMQGEMISSFTGKYKPLQSNTCGVSFFPFRGKDFILATATNHVSVSYAPKAAFELFQIPGEGAEKADSIALFPEKGLGAGANTSYASPMAVDVQADKVLMYIMSPLNGIACYKLTLVGEDGNNTWNMSDPEFNALGSMVTTKEVSGLTIFAADGKSVDVDANAKTLDGWQFTHRIKTGGTGGFDGEGKPLNRVLAFPVPGNSKITVYLQSSSSTADRTLNVAISHKDSIIGTIPALGASISKGVVEYHGGAGTIYLSSLSSGINIYLIQVEPLATSAREVLNPGKEYTLYPNPARERVFINVDKPTDVSVYSITGSLMLTRRVESAGDAIDISGLPQGMYLVRPMGSHAFALKLIVQ